MDHHGSPSPDLLAEVRDRISMQAIQLAGLLGPFWAAATLLGAGLTVARHDMGDAKAAEWLREQADELERDAPSVQ